MMSDTQQQETTTMMPAAPVEEEDYDDNEQRPHGKPWLIAAIVAGALALLAAGWWWFSQSGDRQVKELLERLSQAANSGDRATLESIYPDSRYAEALKFNYRPDEATIEQGTRGDTIVVRFTDGTDLTIAGTDNLHVVSSHGLFVWPEEKLQFAKGTGWFDGQLTDKENSVRLSDEGFTTYLLNQFNEDLKKGLKITKTGTYGDLYFSDELRDYVKADHETDDVFWVGADGMTFTVSNSTPYNVPASAYSITVKSGYWGGGEMNTEIVPGQDIQSGGTVTLRTRTEGVAPNTETDGSQTLVVKGLTMDEFLAQYHPTGNEYKTYQAKYGKVSQSAESLDFVLEGLLGGCGARLTHNTHAHKYLQYNPNGKSLNDMSEQRDVSIINYEPATAHLVMEVKKNGTKTGVLDGTFKNGAYTGQFKSVNGTTSAFSFK